jgi:hypothetical protein
MSKSILNGIIDNRVFPFNASCTHYGTDFDTSQPSWERNVYRGADFKKNYISYFEDVGLFDCNLMYVCKYNIFRQSICACTIRVTKNGVPYTPNKSISTKTS